MTHIIMTFIIDGLNHNTEHNNYRMSLRIMTLTIMTFSKMTFFTMTLCITTPSIADTHYDTSIMGLIVTLSIKDSQLLAKQHTEL